MFIYIYIYIYVMNISGDSGDSGGSSGSRSGGLVSSTLLLLLIYTFSR